MFTWITHTHTHTITYTLLLSFPTGQPFDPNLVLKICFMCDTRQFLTLHTQSFSVDLLTVFACKFCQDFGTKTWVVYTFSRLTCFTQWKLDLIYNMYITWDILSLVWILDGIATGVFHQTANSVNIYFETLVIWNAVIFSLAYNDNMNIYILVYLQKTRKLVDITYVSCSPDIPESATSKEN